MKAGQKRGGQRNSGLLFGGERLRGEAPVPTVCFDLSESQERELPGTSVTTTSCPSDAHQSQRHNGLTPPTLAEHYGALLQREEEARIRVEEKLRLADERLRCCRDEMRKREQQFDEEKQKLLDLLEEKDHILAYEQSQLDARVLEEHERARTENHRLRERVKQLNMIQKNLLKQVSVLLTEREELKRLVEKRPSSRRGRAVSSTSSCVSLHVGDLASAIRNGTKSAELSLSDSHLAQESGDDGLQEVPETARSRPHEESPERSVSRDSGLRWQCSSQELLRQIRLAGYPAARAAIASQKVNGSRGRRTSQGNGRSNPASPLRAKAEEEDFMTSYARHIKAYNLRQNDSDCLGSV
ncbi:unnamed protein product [Symbiodinium sp. KB8]|nr:unnamed protein product [Symbiodinium sp. KB8]